MWSATTCPLPTDGGTTWRAVPTNVSDSAGLLLGSNVRLAFFPAANFAGSPAPLVVRLVDSSSDVPVFGLLTGAFLAETSIAIQNVDVAGMRNGGITAVSDDTVPLNTMVAPLPPDPPITPPVFPVIPPSFLMGSTLQEGGLPTDFLAGANVFRTMLALRPGTVNVSADVFTGTSSPQNLRFEATTVSGGPLPPWLYFDPTLLRFSGIPPESAVGTLDLRVTATDKAGRQATADVHIIITRPPRDLFGLMKPSRAIEPIFVPLPVPAGAPQPAPAEPAPPAAAPVEPQPPTQPSPAPETAPPTNETNRGSRAFEDGRGFGLTAQIREQSLAGRLARSRALLSALSQEGDRI